MARSDLILTFWTFATENYLVIPYTCDVKTAYPDFYFNPWHSLPLSMPPISSQYTQVWFRGVVVITTAQLHSTKPELRFYACLNPACGMPEIQDGEDL